MALAILLCGAVPLDLPSSYDPPADYHNRVLMCCHCHVMESLALLDTEDNQSLTDPLNSLPDVVPRIKVQTPPCEEPDSPVKQILTTQDQSPISQDKSSVDWRQVGQDLRRIADQFESSRRPQSHQKQHVSGSWIQSVIVHGLAAYVGWRIQRWVSGS